MKVIRLEGSGLADWIEDVQKERLLITRGGEPVALLIGIQGMDDEQIEMGVSEEFWEFIKKRRDQETLTREELERKIDTDPSG